MGCTNGRSGTWAPTMGCRAVIHPGLPPTHVGDLGPSSAQFEASCSIDAMRRLEKLDALKRTPSRLLSPLHWVRTARPSRRRTAQGVRLSGSRRAAGRRDGILWRRDQRSALAFAATIKDMKGLLHNG